MKAILNAQSVLTREDSKQASFQYILLVNHTEAIAKGMKLVDEDYKNKIKEFRESDEYKNNQSVQQVLLADKKIELILESVLENRPITQGIKL